MRKWIGTIIVLLVSGNAIANETVVAAIQAYASCLQNSYDARVPTETKTAAADAAFTSCATERNQVAALIPPAQVSSILARIDGIARTALTR